MGAVQLVGGGEARRKPRCEPIRGLGDIDGEGTVGIVVGLSIHPDSACETAEVLRPVAPGSVGKVDQHQSAAAAHKVEELSALALAQARALPVAVVENQHIGVGELQRLGVLTDRGLNTLVGAENLLQGGCGLLPVVRRVVLAGENLHAEGIVKCDKLGRALRLCGPQNPLRDQLLVVGDRPVLV